MPGEELAPGQDDGRVIEHVAIGAMQPRHVLERIGPGSLLIVPGDREDVIEAAIVAEREARRPVTVAPQGRWRSVLRGRPPVAFGRHAETTSGAALVGLLLTGGYRPVGRVLAALREARLFSYLVPDDTYQAASTVHDLLVKTHPDDREKIELTKRIVAEHLDVDRGLARFEQGRPRTAHPARVPRPAGPTASVDATRPRDQLTTARRIARTLQRSFRALR